MSTLHTEETVLQEAAGELERMSAKHVSDERLTPKCVRTSNNSSNKTASSKHGWIRNLNKPDSKEEQREPLLRSRSPKSPLILTTNSYP